LTGIDPGWLDLDPTDLDPTATNVRELSSGDGRIQIAGSRSGGGGRACVCLAGGERRRSAASGGALAGETRSGVPGHD
jgi:hypothetical protein